MGGIEEETEAVGMHRRVKIKNIRWWPSMEILCLFVGCPATRDGMEFIASPEVHVLSYL